MKEDTKKSDRSRPSTTATATKRKRMSDGSENRGENGVSTVKSTSQRNSTATVSVQEVAGTHIAKPNEGRSPRLVCLFRFRRFSLFYSSLTPPKCGTRHLCSDGLRNGGSWSQP